MVEDRRFNGRIFSDHQLFLLALIALLCVAAIPSCIGRLLYNDAELARQQLHHDSEGMESRGLQICFLDEYDFGAMG